MQKEFAEAFIKALDMIEYTNFEYDLVDKRKTVDDAQSSTSTSDVSLSQQLQAKLSDAIYIDINAVKQVMQRLDARLHRGYIYKKVPNG